MATTTVNRRTYTKDSFVDDTVSVDNDRPPEPMQVACSDEDTELAVDAVNPAIEFRMPNNMTLGSVIGFLREPATGQALAFDVHVNGTTIFSTLPTIDATEESTETAATPQVLSNTDLVEGDVVEVFVTQVGSTYGGSGLKVTFKPAQ